MLAKTLTAIRQTIRNIKELQTKSIHTGDEAVEHIATELSVDTETIKKGLLYRNTSNSFTIQPDDLLEDVIRESALKHAFNKKTFRLALSFLGATTGTALGVAAVAAPAASAVINTALGYMFVFGGPAAFATTAIFERLEARFQRANEPHQIRLDALKKQLIEDAASFNKKYGDGDVAITAELSREPQRAPALF